MNLRQKLLITYGGIALMAFLTTGVTLWSTIMWQDTNKLLVDHYRRSMFLQEIETLTIRAGKELADALTALDDSAEVEHAALTISVPAKFEQWSALAVTKEDSDQVLAVQNAYQQIVTDTHKFFDLINKGQFENAALLMEEQYEKVSLHAFLTQTDIAMAKDKEYRQLVRERVDWVRRTDKIILAVTTFGTISLMLLLLAYLRSDVFAPIQVLIEALNGVAAGNYKQRIRVDRRDELGATQDAFNHMVESIVEKQGPSIVPCSEGVDRKPAHLLQELPSRAAVHSLLARLKAQVQEVSHGVGQGNGLSSGEAMVTIIEPLEKVLETVTRCAEFGFPLDIHLAHFDMRGLLYEVVQRFHEVFAQRAVGLEIDVSPEVDSMIGDRLELRVLLDEIIESALIALPELGGCIGIRATLEEKGQSVRIEIADNGVRAETQLVDRASSGDGPGDLRLAIGLALAKSIVEQHNGKFVVSSQPEKGTNVSISLPRNMEP